MSNLLQRTANGAYYHADTPPSWGWTEGGNRLSYEERPRYLVDYYKTYPDRIGVYVNMSFSPQPGAIEAVLYRALDAVGLQKQVVNLRLNNWHGNTSAFWYADLVDKGK